MTSTLLLTELLQILFFSISLMCKENNKGPRTVPCGTPDTTGAQSDKLHLQHVYNVNTSSTDVSYIFFIDISM